MPLQTYKHTKGQNMFKKSSMILKYVQIYVQKKLLYDNYKNRPILMLMGLTTLGVSFSFCTNFNKIKTIIQKISALKDVTDEVLKIRHPTT